MRFGIVFLFFCRFLTLVSTDARAQLAFQAASDTYNGQNVSRISLIANPHRDLQSLYSVVTQKTGEPYSQDKVAADAAALQEAGHFDEVKVSVIPEVNGLRVQFLLEPAYYLGVVEFPEGTRLFSYTQLLQVANLSDEDPYDPAQIPVAENALRDFLHRNGYFQSEVHAQPTIDDDHKLVNMTFSIQVGKRARISSVSIEGPSELEKQKLFHVVGSLRARLSRGLLKTGKTYSRERVANAALLMKKTLTRQHRLASRVQENPPKYDAQTNCVEVAFNVQVGPIVTVRMEGARLSVFPWLGGREEKKLIPIYSEGAVEKELAAEGERNLTDYFQKKGYYDVKVTTDFEKKEDEITIVYKIDRGKKYKVGRIVFHGNSAIEARELLGQVTLKKSHIWTHGSLSQKLLKQSASNIEALYRDRGYEQVKVTPRTVDREPAVDVDFEIVEGVQTIVENVQVSGNQNIPYDQLTAPAGFQLRAGTPFSPRKMADDRNRISATYLNRGYLNAEVKATVQRSDSDVHRINVVYTVAENQMVRVEAVVYLGQQRSQLSLLGKTARIAAETPMRRGDLLGAESRLYDLGIFDWASVGPREPITNQSDEATLVRVHEAKRNEITYGFGFEVSHRGGNVPTGTVALPGGGTIGLNGYQIAPSQSTFASPRGLIEYTRRNMRGLGETAGGSILVSRLDQRVLTTYGQPHFVGSEWSSLSSFSLERNSENPLFTATLGDLAFQVERVVSHKTNTRVQFRYDFNKTALSHILVSGLVLPQDRSVRLSTFSATVIRDTRDKALDAHRGTYATLDLGITPTALGSSADFAKLFGQYGFYKPLHAIVLANSVRIGLATPFANSFVPTSQLYFTGGGTSLRGFPIDQAGPQRLVPFCNVLRGQNGCVNVTVPVGGKQLFILNSEVRFPLGIMKALGGVVFYDGGNVYSAINLHQFVSDYTNTVGFGLRYATPIGPVRFDLGKNLNPVPGLNSWQYFITIGQAF